MHCVVTTINKPTKAIEKLYEIFGNNLIIVGDKKTPEWNYKGFVPMQSDKPYSPLNHYARKNIGYLSAMQNKAELIYDTDDDNIPNENWGLREMRATVNISVGEGWYNVYELFSHNRIWPRGFPLSFLGKEKTYQRFHFEKSKEISSSIQQGISDGEPDVDAIWRLIIDTDNKFEKVRSIYLQKNTWCPFNSQSTWWFPKAYPLMYLPIHATFRMTDIWRSFIAQRCLWELGEGVTFHSPAEVFQDRNEHDLMKDFEDEIPGYLNNDLIVEILSGLKLNGSVCENLLTCYKALVDKNILPATELPSVRAWINDYNDITGNI